MIISSVNYIYKLQNQWEDFTVGDSDSIRGHKEALPFLKPFHFDDNLSGICLLCSIFLIQGVVYMSSNLFGYSLVFQLCEIDLSELLPPDALSPYMDEIKNREKQRKRLARKVPLLV